MRDSDFFDLDPLALYVEISTWVGTCAIGATHYYAWIRFGDHENDTEQDPDKKNHRRLTYVLTQDDARAQNKLEQMREKSLRHRFRKGDECESFFTTHDIRVRAVEVFRQEFVAKGAQLCVQGNKCYCQPQRILDCAPGLEGLMSELNNLFEQGEKFDNWNWDKDPNKELDKLSAQWYALLRKQFSDENPTSA